MFCRISPAAGGLVVTTPGVIRIVGVGLHPSPISDEEIVNIRLMVSSGCRTQRWPFLQVGQRVRIVGGPLRGLEGILLRERNINRLVISIALLQRSSAVEVDAEWVASATPIVSERPLPGHATAVSLKDPESPLNRSGRPFAQSF